MRVALFSLFDLGDLNDSNFKYVTRKISFAKNDCKNHK